MSALLLSHDKKGCIPAESFITISSATGHVLQCQLVQFNGQKQTALHTAYFGTQGETFRLFIGVVACCSLRTVPIQPSRRRSLVAQEPAVHSDDRVGAAHDVYDQT